MSNTLVNFNSDNICFKFYRETDFNNPLIESNNIVSHFVSGDLFTHPTGADAAYFLMLNDEPDLEHDYIAGWQDNTDDLIKLAKKLNIKYLNEKNLFQIIRSIKCIDINNEHIFVKSLYRDLSSGNAYSTSPEMNGIRLKHVGYVYTTPQDFEFVQHEWNVDQAETFINAEIALYNEYLAGNCFAFSLEETTPCSSCKSPHVQSIKSKSGFFGEINKILEVIAHAYLHPHPDLQNRVLSSIR